MTPTPHHPYVSHLVRVAPRPAGVGLDFARWCLSSNGGQDVAEAERTWGVYTPVGTLRLAGPFRRIVPRPRAYRPVRIATGVLEPVGRGLHPVGVTLELLPWSSRWSELALIAGPVRRRECGPRAERAYLQGAHATLDRLVRAVETPPAEWLARLVAGQPLPTRSEKGIVAIRWTGRER